MLSLYLVLLIIVIDVVIWRLLWKWMRVVGKVSVSLILLLDGESQRSPGELQTISCKEREKRRG
jgi:hypothetical protein